jgi:hypothetical protein
MRRGLTTGTVRSGLAHFLQNSRSGSFWVWHTGQVTVGGVAGLATFQGGGVGVVGPVDPPGVPAAPALASAVDGVAPVGVAAVPVDGSAPAFTFEPEPGTTISSSDDPGVETTSVAVEISSAVDGVDVGTAGAPAAPAGPAPRRLPQVPQNSASGSFVAPQTSQTFTEPEFCRLQLPRAHRFRESRGAGEQGTGALPAANLRA